MGNAPWLVILAGPNGAGKMTFAKRFLPKLFPDFPFINVDDLARAVIPDTPAHALASS